MNKYMNHESKTPKEIRKKKRKKKVCILIAFPLSAEECPSPLHENDHFRLSLFSFPLSSVCHLPPLGMCALMLPSFPLSPSLSQYQFILLLTSSRFCSQASG